MMKIINTERLTIRQLTEADASFIHELYNGETFIRAIGDKQLSTVDLARDYIQQGPIAMYHEHEVGLCVVEDKNERDPLGICGLIKRDSLDGLDIGYAFLPQHEGKGYAFESADAVLSYGRDTLLLPFILAITSPENHRSIRLLKKLGFSFVESLAEEERPTDLYRIDFSLAGRSD